MTEIARTEAEKLKGAGHGAHLRLRIASRVMVVAYLGMSMISWALVRDGLNLAERTDRHLLARALANLALVIVGILVTATAYRRGERWAWLANLAGACYGLPLLVIDSRYFGFLSPTVAPEIAGASLASLGLLLPVDLFFRRTR